MAAEPRIIGCSAYTPWQMWKTDQPYLMVLSIIYSHPSVLTFIVVWMPAVDLVVDKWCKSVNILLETLPVY